MPGNWSRLNDPELMLMNDISDSIARWEAKDFRLVPNLRGGQNLLVASDYGGEHQEKLSHYRCYSFLVVDIDNSSQWETLRLALRNDLIPDNRRMAFKKLNGDKILQKGFGPFLHAADHLRGLSFSLLINRQLDGILQAGKGISGPELKEFKKLDPGTFEKMLWVLHVIGLLLGGLSRSGQQVRWITDQDQIAANHDVAELLQTGFENVVSHFVKQNHVNLRFETTSADSGQRELEDLVSVPDLVAGALAELCTLVKLDGVPFSEQLLDAPANLSHKASAILYWLNLGGRPLKRLVYILEPKAPRGIALQRLHMEYHGDQA